MQNVNEMFEYLRLHGKPMLAPGEGPRRPRGAHDASSVTDPWRVDAAYLETPQGSAARNIAFYTQINREPGGKVPKCGALGIPPEYDVDSPYTLVMTTEDMPSGQLPPDDAVIMNLFNGEPRPPGTTNAMIATGDNSHVMFIEWHTVCDGSIDIPKYVDKVDGPGLRSKERIVAGHNQPPRLEISGMRVVREFYDSQGRFVAKLLLNDFVRPAGQTELINKLVEVDPETQRIKRAWMWGDDFGRDRWACVHFAKDGRKQRMEKTNGQVQFFRGPPGRECLRFATCDPTSDDNEGHVTQCYAGPPGAAYLTRATCQNGDIKFYRGDVPQKVSVERIWHPDGTVTYYQGRRGEERPTGTGFQPRESGQQPPTREPVLVRMGSCPFVRGAKVRPHGLTRQDLNGRLGTVRGWDEEDQRCHVQFGTEPSVRIKLEKLVSEEAYQEDRAARNAVRSATAQERIDRNRAQRLARLEARSEQTRAAAALQAATDAPFDASLAPPTPPASERVCLHRLATCPVSHVLMKDPVLAADGYVYDEAALRVFWEDHGFVSPITKEPIAAFCLPHIPLRSLALEISASPSDAKWHRVPRDVPDFLECPISQEVMEHPVRASDGNVYDRDMLGQWFAAGKVTSPLFGTEMNEELREDKTMAAACRAWA